MDRSYYVYINTNPTKTVLYVGFTNNLEGRLIEHYLERLTKKTFAGKYNCYCLVHYEEFFHPMDGIDREKEIKGWTRKKKEILIEKTNPEWKFLNSDLMSWPPPENAEVRAKWEPL